MPRDFLAARRELLATAATSFLDDLRGGASADTPTAGGVDYGQEHPTLIELVQLCGELGLAAPKLNHEIVDDDTSEVLAIADAVWPDGAQPGLSQSCALLLEPDKDTEARFGAMGYRFFVDRQQLEWYFEELTGVDIDGDGVIGALDGSGVGE